MNDCPNADIRDQLPDLLHDRLDVSMRAAVLAHVDACVDCRAELELLRGVHGMLVMRTPRVDINYVVNALPRPRAVPSAERARLAPRRHVWSDWRIAAAVTVLAVGGGSFALLRQGVNPATGDSIFAESPAIGSTSTPSRDSTTPTAPSQVADAGTAPSGSTSVARGSAGSADEQAGLATTARLTDLNERQLQALLDQIDQLQAVPITEPEPVTIRVNNKSTSPEGA